MSNCYLKTLSAEWATKKVNRNLQKMWKTQQNQVKRDKLRFDDK